MEKLIDDIAGVLSKYIKLEECSQANQKFYRDQAREIIAMMPFGEIRELASVQRMPRDETLDKILSLITEPKPDEPVKGGCYDCNAPYGESGWCDVIIPDEIWNEITPENGILCFRCMTKRLENKGFKDVPVNVVSGPYKDANEEWRLIGWKHGFKVGKEEIK